MITGPSYLVARTFAQVRVRLAGVTRSISRSARQPRRAGSG